MKAQDNTNGDNLECLVRAVWAAGFRVGLEHGSDAATAYEHGSRSQLGQNPNDAWAEEMEWRMTAITPFDIGNPEHWDNVP